MYIAYISNCKLEIQILLAGDLPSLKADLKTQNSCNFEKLKKDIEEVERMLKGLIKSLENKHPIRSKWT